MFILRKVLCVVSLLLTMNFYAQSSTTISPLVVQPVDSGMRMMHPTKQILEIPAVLTLASFVTIPVKQEWKEVRDHYASEFRFHYDDYTQYLPAVVMLGVKSFGIEGRSTWGRMLASDALSMVTMVGLVNGLKYSLKVQRPGNGAYNSYPSGHTSTAFMTATLLHKEYGHVSPWYSVGGYVTAISTGVSRILNDKHWVSDVFLGAAIGIVSVELGYFLADLLFEKKGLNYDDRYDRFTVERDFHPSYFSLYNSVSLKTVSLSHGVRLQANARVGFEGVYFMNPYVGFGGQVGASILELSKQRDPEVYRSDLLSSLGGVYLSYPLSRRWRAGAKSIAGVNLSTAITTETIQIPVVSPTWISGVSASYMLRQNFGVRCFADYGQHFNLVNRKNIHEFYLGVSIDGMIHPTRKNK